MQNLKIEKKIIKKPKIKKDTLKKICYFFSKGYTATHTSKEVGFSRQTINNYYKNIRLEVINKQDELILNRLREVKTNVTLELRYVNINNRNVFYFEEKHKIYFLEEDFLSPLNINQYIPLFIKESLVRHKKASAIKISFDTQKQEFKIIRYITSNNTVVQDFMHNYLKQYRGINKDNFLLYIKESQFRFNYSSHYIFNTLCQSFDLKVKP